MIAHLKDAVTLNATSPGEIYLQLLCNAEESGNQHVYYYRARDSEVASACDDHSGIASSLLGKGWEKRTDLPLLELVNPGDGWSDFRRESGTNRGPSGWTAKFYAAIKSRTLLKREQQSEDIELELWQTHVRRDIFLVRWSSSNLLQLRIPRTESRAQIHGYLEHLWNGIGKAVRCKDFTPVSFASACRELIKHQADNVDEYRLGPIRCMDNQAGSAVFTPPSHHEDVMSDQRRQAAIKMYDEYKELIVTWLPSKSAPAIQSELRSIIGRFGDNCLTLTSRTTAEAVNHVTNRLCRS
ncbi:MAG: hypothetical protein ACLP7Q_27065 [Isosphaeraceae bacterium]